MQPEVRDVAIIVPCFNGSGTVRETLESVQAQEGGLDRVSCVFLADDHSSDETCAVARSCWTSRVPLVVVQNAANKGPWTNINDTVSGFSSQIQWFFILHQDDIARPNWLQVMLRGIDQAGPRTASLTASYDVLFPDGHVEPGEDFGEQRKVLVEGNPASIRDTLKRGCWFKVSSCAIRVSAFHDLGGFMPVWLYSSDWDFLLRALRAAWDIEYIPLCLSVFRRSAVCLSSKCFQKHLDVQEGLSTLDRFGEFLTPRELAARHVSYLYTLARRAGASVIRRDLRRLTAAGAVGIQVAASLCRSGLRRIGKESHASPG